MWHELHAAGRIGYHPVFPGQPGFGARRIESDDDVRDVSSSCESTTTVSSPARRPDGGLSAVNGIVTGASRGLGLALTRALAERGWQLVVDARDGDALELCRRRARGVAAFAGDVTDPEHLERLVAAVGKPIDLLVNNASALGTARCLRSPTTRSTSCVGSTRSTCSLRWPSSSSRFPHLSDSARIVNVSSDAAVEAYEGWGGYGSSKAALAQMTAVLAAEHPKLRVYTVDPGDMRTQMQQDAFPGEDISDRPPPEESVPGLLELIEGDLPSGSYGARPLVEVPT